MGGKRARKELYLVVRGGRGDGRMVSSTLFFRSGRGGISHADSQIA